MFCVIDKSLTQTGESIFINSLFFKGNLHLTCKCSYTGEFSFTKLYHMYDPIIEIFSLFPTGNSEHDEKQFTPVKKPF